jgi:hypothetical protein
MELLLDFYRHDTKYSIKNVYFIDYTVKQGNDRILYSDTQRKTFSQYLLYLCIYKCNVILKYLILLIVYEFTYKPINLIYLEVLGGNLQIELSLYFKRNNYFVSYNHTLYMVAGYDLSPNIKIYNREFYNYY